VKLLITIGRKTDHGTVTLRPIDASEGRPENNMKYALAILAALGALLTGTGTAHADTGDTGDTMYAVGTDIQPGTYRYTVTGHDWGYWKLCGDANCDNVINIAMVEGEGHTGYVTVTATAKYLQLHYLTLSPMR
jgi:hypothetical protein